MGANNLFFKHCFCFSYTICSVYTTLTSVFSYRQIICTDTYITHCDVYFPQFIMLETEFQMEVLALHISSVTPITYDIRQTIRPQYEFQTYRLAQMILEFVVMHNVIRILQCEQRLFNYVHLLVVVYLQLKGVSRVDVNLICL